MKLVLLDRDGVINENRDDFVKTPDEFVLLPGVAESIKRLNEHHIRVVLVADQPAIGKKIITEDQLSKIHAKMAKLLAKKGAKIDKIIVCGDHPDSSSSRRKPGAGMLTEAMVFFNAFPNQTIMIGDDLSDIQASLRANCHRMLVLTGNGRKTLDAGIPTELNPVNICNSLNEGVDNILSGHLKQKG